MTNTFTVINDIIFKMISPSIFLIIIIVFIFYIPLLPLLLKLTKQKRARREFYHSVFSIFNRVEDNDLAIEQLLIVHKKLSERFPHINIFYKSATHFIEDLFMRVEAFGNEQFKDAYKLEFDDRHKDRMVEIIKDLKTRQPFSSVSSKYGNLLSMMKHSFDTNNQDLGLNSLKQLADDIEVMESTIESQSRRNQISIIVSIVGVILTVIFGVITVLQFVFASN